MLARPRIARKYGVTAEDITQLVALILEKAELVETSGALRLCRDPDDDLVLETAINGRADVLVTRDEDMSRDLDVIAALEQRGVRVLTVRQFLAELKARRP